MNIIASILFVFILSSCVATDEVETVNQLNSSKVDVKVINPEDEKDLSIVPQIHVMTNWESQVEFLGYIDTYAGKADGSGMVYSGDAGAAGLLVQILAHAAISNSMQKKKANEKQEAANQILRGYDDLISKIDHITLFDSSRDMQLKQKYQIKRAGELATFPFGDVVVNIHPQYFLSTDERSMMLKMEVSTYSSLASQASAQLRTVKVISERIELARPYDGWVKGSPSHFEITAFELFAEGLDFVIDDFLDDVDQLAAHKTYSYMFGERKKYERASLLRRSCNRSYLRNLKQDLVVIPSESICDSSDSI